MYTLAYTNTDNEHLFKKLSALRHLLKVRTYQDNLFDLNPWV